MLEDWRTAPIDDRLRAALGFLEKLTRTPEEIGPGDVQPMREAGLSDEAIETAIMVCATFAVLTRVADALEFNLDQLTPKYCRRFATYQITLNGGYEW